MPNLLFIADANSPYNSPIPPTYKSALKDPNWRQAMLDEYTALMNNSTWSLVPKPAGVNVVTGKWIYRHKFNMDGSLAWFKARWVVRGFTQREGVDYDEMSSPVFKPATIRVVLSIATSHSWPIHQMDVKNAFPMVISQARLLLPTSWFCRHRLSGSCLPSPQVSLRPQASSSHVVSSLSGLPSLPWGSWLQE